MIEESKSINDILPFGEALRSFCVQPFISKSDLVKHLRNRGIFIHNSEKKASVPIILTLLNSPKEFDFLRECQIVNEDSPKNVTRTIEWNSQSSILEALSTGIDVNKLSKDEFCNYKLMGSPNFVPVDGNPDKIRLEYDLERIDNSRNFFRSKDRFKGTVEFEKVVINKQVSLVLTHTSQETKRVNQKIAIGIVSHFRDNGHIKNDSIIRKILLSSFTNEQRIQFLWNLIGAVSDDDFEFANNIIDVGFCPDDRQTFPEDIKWMETRVNSLKVHGSDLQNTFFLDDKNYHQYFIFGNIDARYKFNFENIKGSCVISYAFPNFLSDKNAEFEIDVVALNLEENKRNWSRNHIKGYLLKRVEKHKIEEFENIFNDDKLV
jgi:hypothetical protein